MAIGIMSNLLNNGIFQSVIGAIIFALIVWGYKKVHFSLDERKICNFIKESKDTFRSTEAISSSTNIESSRIQHVAAKSKKIRRNAKEKESWCLVE